jgi:UDP-N-acetylmuramoylalanine--D-glutamate ligase
MVPLHVIAEVLRSFHGVEHRLEYVAELGGVKYYNNSKATNASAAIKALEAIDAPIVLIAGGLDRGAEYGELVPVLRERVKALVLLGETREKLRRAGEQAGVAAIDVVEGDGAEAVIREAVRRASALAEPGDVVMLNPACASWDMFSSYEERGRMFKESVHNLE